MLLSFGCGGVVASCFFLLFLQWLGLNSTAFSFNANLLSGDGDEQQEPVACTPFSNAIEKKRKSRVMIEK